MTILIPVLASVGGMTLGWLGGLLWARRRETIPPLVKPADIVIGQTYACYGRWVVVTDIADDRVTFKPRGLSRIVMVCGRDRFKDHALRPETEIDRAVRKENR